MFHTRRRKETTSFRFLGFRPAYLGRSAGNSPSGSRTDGVLTGWCSDTMLSKEVIVTSLQSYSCVVTMGRDPPRLIGNFPPRFILRILSLCCFLARRSL